MPGITRATSAMPVGRDDKLLLTRPSICPQLPATTGLCVLLWFFCCGVDVALMLGARMQKAPRRALRKVLISLRDLVAGTGFEPVTFRL